MADDLARLAAWVADDLDAKGYSFAGVVRRAAQRLAAVPDVEDGGCEGCGAPLERKATGRRRKWCGDGRCGRKRARTVR